MRLSVWWRLDFWRLQCRAELSTSLASLPPWYLAPAPCDGVLVARSRQASLVSSLLLVRRPNIRYKPLNCWPVLKGLPPSRVLVLQIELFRAHLMIMCLNLTWSRAMVFFQPGFNLRLPSPVDTRTSYSYSPSPHPHHHQTFHPSPHIEQTVLQPGPGTFSPSYPTPPPVRGDNKVPDFFPNNKIKVSSFTVLLY